MPWKVCTDAFIPVGIWGYWLLEEHIIPVSQRKPYNGKSSVFWKDDFSSYTVLFLSYQKQNNVKNSHRDRIGLNVTSIVHSFVLSSGQIM